MKKHKHEYRLIALQDNDTTKNYTAYCVWCLGMKIVNGYHVEEYIKEPEKL